MLRLLSYEYKLMGEPLWGYVYAPKGFALTFKIPCNLIS